MPELVRFYGIVIKMYFSQKEHNIPPIHAIYGEFFGSIDIRKREMIVGDLPNKALKLVIEWIDLHEKELLEMWETQKIRKLDPLV